MGGEREHRDKGQEQPAIAATASPAMCRAHDHTEQQRAHPCPRVPCQPCTCHSARPSATASRCCHDRMIHDLRGWPAGMLESSYSRLTPFSSRPGCRNLHRLAGQAEMGGQQEGIRTLCVHQLAAETGKREQHSSSQELTQCWW